MPCAHSLLHKLAAAFEELEPPLADDGLDVLRQCGAQLRLSLEPKDELPRRRKARRAAAGRGFSLHADTHVRAHDGAGLAHLVRHGARGPIAESRLSLRSDRDARCERSRCTDLGDRDGRNAQSRMQAVVRDGPRVRAG